jgi:hypothetical protein
MTWQKQIKTKGAKAKKNIRLLAAGFNCAPTGIICPPARGSGAGAWHGRRNN